MRLIDRLMQMVADRQIPQSDFAAAIGMDKNNLKAILNKRNVADGYTVDYLAKAVKVLKCTQAELDELNAIAAGKTYQKHLQGKRLYTKPAEVDKTKPINVYGSKRYEKVLAMVKAGKTDAEIMEEWPEMTVDVLAVYHKIAEKKLTKMAARDGMYNSNSTIGRPRTTADVEDGLEELYVRILRATEKEQYAGETMEEADKRISAEEAAKWRVKPKTQDEPKKRKAAQTGENGKKHKRYIESEHAYYDSHREEILERRKARYREQNAEKIKAREEKRMSDKLYSVMWYEKEGAEKYPRSMMIKARTALEAKHKFKMAYAGAKTGKHAFNLQAKLMGTDMTEERTKNV